MWATEISRQTSATKEQVWNLWADVANWKSWDSTVKSNGLLVTYRQSMTGFPTFLFSAIMGKMMTKGLAKGIEDLIKYAEKIYKE